MSQGKNVNLRGGFIDHFELQTSRSVHSGERLEIEVAARLDVDLTPLMPYLNAELPGARYTPSIPALVWMVGDHQIGILPDRIAVDHIHEDEDPIPLLEYVARTINDIWGRREAIEPRHSPRSFRQPLEIYTLLPQTNCQLCGVQTCYNFALKLTAGLAELTECTTLFDPDADAQKRGALETLILEKDPTE